MELASAQTTDWILRKTNDGIQVYTRHVTGFDIDQLKTTCTIHSSLASIVSVITDVPDYTKWIYKCTEARILQQVSDTEQYQYQVNDLPYPFSDRDVIIHFTVHQDAQTKVVTTKSVASPTFIAESDGKVRMKVFEASYTLTPLPGGFVNIQYLMQVDPAGYIPDWLVNMTVITGPYESTVKMRERILSSQNVILPFIKEAN